MSLSFPFRISSSRNHWSIPQRQTGINRVFLDLKNSVELLGVDVSDEEVESWAITINFCMASNGHSYHNVRRIFDVSDGGDPIQVFAAAFHACIRYEMFGLPPEAAKLLDGVIEIKEGNLRCAEIDFIRAPHEAMVFVIFGFVPGQRLTFMCGQSKFLCALLAVRVLKDKLPMKCLVEIAVCMQAAKNAHVLELQYTAQRLCQMSLLGEYGEPEQCGMSKSDNHPLEQLHTALVNANETFELSLNESQMTEAVQRGADLALRSYQMYANSDTARVVDLMWSWLSQVNPNLSSRKLYTVDDYHMGIKMAAEMWNGMEFEKVFASFRGVPDPSYVRDIIQRAEQNREAAVEHTNANSVSLALLAAFAILTGGNAPMSFFVGDHPSQHPGHTGSDQLGEFLPTIATEELDGCNIQVYELLAMGRRSKAAFDAGMALVTAFVYGKLGSDGTRNLLGYTDYPMDEAKAKGLLESLPLDVIVPIGKEIARIAVSRTDRFEKLLKSLKARATVKTA